MSDQVVADPAHGKEMDSQTDLKEKGSVERQARRFFSDEDIRNTSSSKETGSLPSLTPTQLTKEMEAGGFSDDISKTPSLQIESKPKFLIGCQTRDDVGTCLIVFALPLLIPGVTLTAVAYDDETGFSKYSVLHIIGILMLAMAVIFILVGVALIVRIGYKVVPECQGGSSHSVTTHDRNRLSFHEYQGYKPTVMNSQEEDVKTPEPLSPFRTSNATAVVITGATNVTSAAPLNIIPPPKTPLNFMIEEGQGPGADTRPSPHKGSTVGSLPPITRTRNQVSPYEEYVSSTDYEDDSDELDSDENSCGSYIVSGENAVFNESNEDIFRDNATPETSVIVKPGPCKTSFTPRTRLSLDIPQSNNFFFNEDNTSLPESRKIKRLKKAKLGFSNSASIDDSGEYYINDDAMSSENGNSVEHKTQEPPKKLSPIIAFSSPSPLGSPRHRLEAFSNASALASSMQMKNSEELLPENIVGEMSESNGSVFTGEEIDGAIADDADKKCHSADDVKRSKPSSPPVKTFTYDMTFTPENENANNASGVTDATGSAVKDDLQKKEEYTSRSPKLVSILRSNSAYDSSLLQERDDPDNSQGSDVHQHNSDIITSAIFSPPIDIINYMNKDSTQASHARHMEPVPLKSKKRATFQSVGDDRSVNVTFFE